MGSFITKCLYIQEKLEEMLKICYEFGCYLNLQHNEEEIEFSLYSKIYYAGLNYYALKETMRDFQGCIETLKVSVDITVDETDDGNEVS